MKHALNQHEDIQLGTKTLTQKLHIGSVLSKNDLISSYRNGLNGNLEASLEDTNFIGFEIDDMESLNDQEKILASSIEDYCQQTKYSHLPNKRAVSLTVFLDFFLPCTVIFPPARLLNS